MSFMLEFGIIDERAARRDGQACCNPECRETRNTTKKMFTCTACKVALYCSPECQREDWAAHKPICKNTQRQNALIAAQDKIILAQRGPKAPLLMTDVVSELRAFMKHFRAHIHVAAINTFCTPTRPRKMAPEWEEDILCVYAERRGEITPDMPLWARFKITLCRRCPADMYAEIQVELNPAAALEMNALIKTREELTREARRRGPGHGGVLLVFQWNTPIGNSCAPYAIRLSPRAIENELFVDDPFKHLETMVEQISTSWREGKADHTVVSSLTCKA